jgi:hypothetical protein
MYLKVDNHLPILPAILVVGRDCFFVHKNTLGRIVISNTARSYHLDPPQRG